MTVGALRRHVRQRQEQQQRPVRQPGPGEVSTAPPPSPAPRPTTFRRGRPRSGRVAARRRGAVGVGPALPRGGCGAPGAARRGRSRERAARHGDELGTKRGGRGARSSGSSRLPTSGRDRVAPGRERRAAEPWGGAHRAASKVFALRRSRRARAARPLRSRGDGGTRRGRATGGCRRCAGAALRRRLRAARCGAAVLRRGVAERPAGAGRGTVGAAHAARRGRAAALRSETGAGSSRRLRSLRSFCGRSVFRVPAIITSRAVLKGALLFQAGLPSRRIAEKYLPCSAKLRGPARWCCSICGRRLPRGAGCARTGCALRSRDGLLPGHGHGRAGSGGGQRRSDGLSQQLSRVPSSPRLALRILFPRRTPLPSRFIPSFPSFELIP